MLPESASNHLPMTEATPPVNDSTNSANEGASNGANKSDIPKINCTEDFVSPGDSSLGRKRKSEALEESVGSDDESNTQIRKKMRTISPVAEDGEVGDVDDVADEEKNERKKDDAPVLLSPVDDGCVVPVPLRRVDSGEWIGCCCCQVYVYWLTCDQCCWSSSAFFFACLFIQFIIYFIIYLYLPIYFSHLSLYLFY